MSTLFATVQRSKLLLFVWHVLSFMLLINFLVIPHELGHLLTGLAFGAAVDAFSVGFGPEIISFTAFDIEWRFSSILLGGYVQFAAEAGGGEVLIGELAAWKQVTIFASGVVANLIYAFLLCQWLKPRDNSDVIFPLNNRGPLCVPFAVNAGYGIAKGWKPFLWYSACANIELAVFNLLPISILDGGRIAEILVFQHLRAAGIGDIVILIGGLAVGFLVVLPLMVKAVRPLAHRLQYW